MWSNISEMTKVNLLSKYLHYLPLWLKVLLLTWGIKTLKYECVGGLVSSWCLSACCLLSGPWTVCLLSCLSSSITFNIFHLGQILDTFSSLISQGLWVLYSLVVFHLIPVMICYLIINKYLVCFIRLKVSGFCVLTLLKLGCCVCQKASPLAYTLIYT